MLRSLLIALTPFLLAVSVNAQRKPFVYGDISDLKGVTKVFVDSGRMIQAREQIIKVINKKLPQLSFVKQEQDAEVILEFNERFVPANGGLTTTSIVDGKGASDGRVKTTTNPTPSSTDRDAWYAEGFVFKRDGPDRNILVMDFYGAFKARLFDKRNTTAFADEFVKAYKKANKT